jgi:ATP-binding cassette subfamily F protein 3
MIQLFSAGKRYGSKLLFENVDWQITSGDRIGLVGANGSGKTTLLRILSGLDSLDSGSISIAGGVTAGYLPQYGLTLSGKTVFEECLSVFDRLRYIEAELETLMSNLGTLDPATAEYHEVTEKIHRLEAEFDAGDGYALESRVGAVLLGLGFAKSDWTRRTEEFSGGWQMRIALAKLLLERPNLLLLDEPTNHLDLEARNWLEEYLRSYPYAFIVVSHDRYFLDVTVKKIAEIWNRSIHFYSGSYSRYLEQKAEKRAQMEAAYKNQQLKIRQLEAFINRFRYQATKARQVQSRLKELAHMEKIELPPEEKTLHFMFPQAEPSGRIVAECYKASKSYGDKLVISEASFLIERGDRVAVIGPNGAGKSTLVKILAGVESLTTGECRLGHNVKPDYFAQDQYKELDPEIRLLDDLSSIAPQTRLSDLRSLLGCFLFSEEDVSKPVGVLSGGERNRYALARLLVHPSNFLLLDEPTNHLDLRAKDVLLEALEQFTGTVVFVSHDRYFIDKLATRVLEIDSGWVNIYPGNYEDYLWRKSARTEMGGTAMPSRYESSEQPVAPQRPVTIKTRRLNPIRLKQLERSCEEIEEKVAALEKEINEYEKALAVFESAEQSRRLGDLLKDRREQLAALLAEWESIAEQIETSRGRSAS